MHRTAQMLALLLGLFLAFGTARADEIEIREAELRVSEEGLVLNAEFSFDLNARLADAVRNGIPLYFLVEFELTRPRWYWFDEKTLTRSLQMRLSYHALSRQYRLSTGALHLSFATLDQAEGVMRRVRNWVIAERNSLPADADFEAAVRMRLDRTLLPKPFQLSALTNSEWHLESPWKRFPFRLQSTSPAPVESRESTRGDAR
jgi:hypothetical protein